MLPPISTSTRLIALLGDPVEHSLSPAFQNAAIRASGLDAVYVALRCAETDVAGLVRGIALSGGGGNVTLPHKAAAARAIDRGTEAVAATGVCNTFWSEGGTVWGDNTDPVGVSAAVEAVLGRTPYGATVLMLGAGGSARAAAYALLQDGVGRLVLVNRSRPRADELRSAFPHARQIQVETELSALRGETFDLVVNATSLGLRPDDPLPLPLNAEVGIGAGLDLVYSRSLTPWVRVLQAAGIPAADGLEMLLQQGAASFRRWFGKDAPMGVMRERVMKERVKGEE